MDRKVIFIWLFLFLPITLFSQARDSSEKTIPKTYYYKRIYVGVSYGLTYPMGSFSKENAEFNNSAFAQKGRNICFFDFGYRIGKTLGVTGYLFNSSNPVDHTALLKKLPEVSGINYFASEGGDYELRGMMLGLLVSKYSNVVDLDLKFMLGNAKFNIPHLAFSYTQDNIQGARQERYIPTSENTFGIGLGMGIRIHINQFIDFTTNTNYLIFQNSFNRLIEDRNGFRREEFELTHETFNLNFGIAYRFLNDKTILYEH